MTEEEMFFVLMEGRQTMSDSLVDLQKGRRYTVVLKVNIKSKAGCVDLNGVPPNSGPSESQKVTFQKEGLPRCNLRPYWMTVSPKPMTSVLIHRGKCGQRHTEAHAEDHVKTEAEVGIMHL